MKKKKDLIKVYQKHCETQTTGYDDSILYHSSATTFVEILNVTRKFEDDKFMHAARAWVNKTFAEDAVDEIKNKIAVNKIKIEELQREITTEEKKLDKFLVPVTIVK